MTFSPLPCLVFTISQHFKIGKFHMRVQILGGLDLLVVSVGPETLGVHFPSITTELRKTAHLEEHGLSRLLESLPCHPSLTHNTRWLSHILAKGLPDWKEGVSFIAKWAMK